MPLVLGIDPATSCGWALLDGDRRLGSGAWDLSAKRHEGGGMRFLRARRYLCELLDHHPVEAVAYEVVRRHLGVDAAHVYGGIVAVVSEECERRGLPYRGIPVGTVKRNATGDGSASKGDMVRAANGRWGLSLHVELVERVKKGKAVHVEETSDDDEADALWVAFSLGVELGWVETPPHARAKAKGARARVALGIAGGGS
jgi:Holliday junction resolvasome RuvABC endonuclease subunit